VQAGNPLQKQLFSPAPNNAVNLLKLAIDSSPVKMGLFGLSGNQKRHLLGMPFLIWYLCVFPIV
jgi:hypothetical protein